MKKKLTNNLGLKLAAVVLAVIIWLVIHSIADPVITKEFTARWKYATRMFSSRKMRTIHTPL